MIVRVKFCGMTREEDVRAAVEVGADFIGLVFAESPRRVTIESAARRPAPIARITVAAPVTMSPPAQTPFFVVLQVCGCDLI